MEARGTEESQPRRPIIKRPWDEGRTYPEETNHRLETRLPPIDTLSYSRAPLSLGADSHDEFSRYGLDSRPYDGARKKARHGRPGCYNTLSQENLDLNGKMLQRQASNTIHNGHRSPVDPPSYPQTPIEHMWAQRGGNQEGPADYREGASLCVRCRKLTSQFDVYESTEDRRKDPNLVCQKAAAGLSQLADTLHQLKVGMSSEQRGAIHVSERRGVNQDHCPPIEQLGLSYSLNWLLDKLHDVNELADSVLGIAALGAVNDRTLSETSSHLQDAPMDFMKRRMEAHADEQSRSETEVTGPTSETMQSRRRSQTATIVPSDDLPSVSSHNASQIASIMNPPPVRSRQLPSPPGRSLPSPMSANFPSPSTGSYGSNPQSVSLPPPGSLHQSSFLPPFGSTHSSDALQAHSAALQHEISIQKIALSSLQGEHDKLLAAFSRSQTRASALEKKHAVSDSEIISLTEEKLRLQSQVLELERDMEDLARSRDGFRQAAVQESAQYVEIVKRASQLEIMAGDERKTWNKQKAEMELRIKAMSTGTDVAMAETLSNAVNSDTPIHNESIPASSHTDNEVLKVEPNSNFVPIPIVFQQDQDDELREEIRQLRRQCAEAEDALRTVRDDSNNMEGVLQALGLTRKSISERADRALMDICMG